jgi:hypothetical protein
LTQKAHLWMSRQRRLHPGGVRQRRRAKTRHDSSGCTK